MSVARDLRLLSGLARRRAAATLRRPTLPAILGAGLPLAVLAALAWAAGSRAAVRVTDGSSAAMLGMLLAGIVAQLCYGALFRGDDASFLRRLGLEPRALYLHRFLRLLRWAALCTVLLLLPIASAGLPLGLPLAAAAGAALASCAFGAAGYAGAARAMAGHRPGTAWGCLAIGMWDRDVAGAAPLVWAPLAPFLAGTAAAAWIGTGSAPVGRLALVAAVCAAVLAAGARWYEGALPRFGAQAQELAFEPTVETTAGELAPRRGLSILLPRGAALVRARDAVVVGRRFAWASRLVWPVAIGSLVALARWGEMPGTREVVGAAAVLVLAAQGAAGVGLGRAEGAGRRWVDRSVGIGEVDRLLGRWAWGWGASLWLTVPLALAWSWWSGAEGGALWIAAGAATAALGALASIAAAGGVRR